MTVNFDDPGGGGGDCYNFVLWLPGYIYDFDVACRNHAAQAGNQNPENEYACAVQGGENGGVSVQCCYAGG